MAGDRPVPGTGGPPDSHPLLVAVAPLVARIGATVVAAEELGADDVPLSWDGLIVAGIHLPAAIFPAPTSVDRGAARPEVVTGAAGIATDSDTVTGLDGMLAELAAQFGAPLAGLPRARKQEAVRMLEENGAFSYRKSVETVAAALGISRFTVYNYLNRDRA
jgi:hypothetical protein